MSNSAVGLDLNDLKLMSDCIRASLKRGAFEPEEIRKVGELYEKINKFIAHIQDNFLQQQNEIENNEVGRVDEVSPQEQNEDKTNLENPEQGI